jgi:hypothetical protein
MKIQKATERYEKWLDRQLTLLPHDLRLKHERMASAAFPFFRATFYRWMQVWPEVCPKFQRSPAVLAVGDLHVENFGTWRDLEGRLVWGINDFDEACHLPYAVDLVRLAASALVAYQETHLALTPAHACEAILEGYRSGIKTGGRPFILGEEHHWLRVQATGAERDPVVFWRKMDALYRWRKEVPKRARKGLEKMLPDPELPYTLCTRIAGLGSLGRQRFVAIANWKGAKIARETKALAPTAALWAGIRTARSEVLYKEILASSVRCPDPMVTITAGKKNSWIVRRLAPYCSRIELAQLPKQREELRLLHSMGFETANIHWGSPSQIPALKKDLNRRRVNWLLDAATRMTESVRNDWKAWKKGWK